MIKTKATSALLILVSCLGLFACSQESGKSTENTTARVTTPVTTPVIGHLKTRDKLITVQIGQNGPLYNVASNEGTVLAMDLSETDLVAQFPELKEVIEQGVADWADLDLRHQETPEPVDL